MIEEQSKHRVFNKRSLFSACMAVVLAAGLSIPVSTASAVTAKEKQAEANAALAKLNGYQAELEEATANYEEAQSQQIEAEHKAKEAQTKIDDETKKIEGYQDQLAERARNMYRSGDTSFIDVILGASTFEEFATTWGMLETLNTNDAELVQETKTARQELESAKTEYEHQAKTAADKAAEAKVIADNADTKAEEMQAVYDSLSAEAADLVEKEREAEEKAAAEAALAAIHDNAANDNDTNTNNGGSGINNNNDDNGHAGSSHNNDDADDSNDSGSHSNSGSSSNNSSSGASQSNASHSNNSNASSGSSTPSTSRSRSAIVNRAYAQLGKPYKWGAVGPSSYDCSGLVSYCVTGKHQRYCTSGAVAGWPRTSNPQPGDICVKSGHVGIYIGGGKMIHAPQTGDVVKISAVHRGMWYVVPR